MNRAFILSMSVFVLIIGSISFGANAFVVMETNFGNITYELYPDKAPVTVENFLGYVNEGFYDGLVFHRAIENFVIQGGGYYSLENTIYYKQATNPPIVNESENGLSNLRGTLAMARTAEPDSATTQFYINHVDNFFLDYENASDGVGYCVFGSVIGGMDVVDAIAQAPTIYVAPNLPDFPYDPSTGAAVEIIRAYEVPEPATVMLLALGGLALRRKR